MLFAGDKSCAGDGTITLRNARAVSKQDEDQAVWSESICWICHEGHSNEEGGAPLLQPCKCSIMAAHRACLARWQLQQAGKPEERCCRFCNAELPDWREAHSQLPQAPPIMTVVHLGVTHQVRVEPGPDGRQRFQSEIRRIFNLNDRDAIQLTFGCRIPGSTVDQEIQLEGWESFDAAVYCAGVSAGQRTRDSEGHKPPSVERRSSGGVLRRLFSRNTSQH